jgi:hypothetical protein
MHARTAITACSIAAALTLAGCSSSDSKSPASTKDAASAWAAVHAAVPTSRFTLSVTEANDGNHLIGRPSQYTSAMKFSDSRVNIGDVDGLDKDDVQRGGGIEVFSNHGDAATRAKYIQAVTKALPVAAEYDYVHGAVLVRVSHYLTPSQAREYDQAAAKLD